MPKIFDLSYSKEEV